MGISSGFDLIGWMIGTGGGWIANDSGVTMSIVVIVDSSLERIYRAQVVLSRGSGHGVVVLLHRGKEEERRRVKRGRERKGMEMRMRMRRDDGKRKDE
jgi:hypothetical protein